MIVEVKDIYLAAAMRELNMMEEAVVTYVGANCYQIQFKRKSLERINNEEHWYREVVVEVK